MIAAAPDKLRLAKSEQDSTTDHVPDAARFLKVNGVRRGRDLELYARLMAKVAGEGEIVVMFLEEVVLPVKAASPEAYRAGLEHMRCFNAVFDGENQEAWTDMLNEFLQS